MLMCFGKMNKDLLSRKKIKEAFFSNNNNNNNKCESGVGDRTIGFE